VLSGEPQALEEVIQKLEKRGVFCRRIKVDVASHSPQMDEIRGELLGALSSVKGLAPRITMQSTVVGRAVKEGELNANYWVSNLREPVLFAQGVDQLLKSGHDIYLEMSPHPILLPSVQEALENEKSKGVAVASLRREQDDRRVLLESVAALHAQGLSVDWKQLNGEQGQLVPLPTYPWQRERYWLEETAQAQPVVQMARSTTARTGPVVHPLLGTPVPLSVEGGPRFWEYTLSAETAPYLVDHQVQGEVVVPAAAYSELGLAAAAATHGEKPYVLEDVSFQRMLSLSASNAYTVQVALTDKGEGRMGFQVSSLQNVGWIRHAAGSIRANDELPVGERVMHEPPKQIIERCPNVISTEANYELLKNQGLEYGPYFQGVKELWHGAGEVLGRVTHLEGPEAPLAGYRLHPALLDSCFQVLGVLLFAPEGSETGEPETYVAVGMEKVHFYRPLEREVWAHGRLRKREGSGKESRIGDVVMMNEAGEVLAEVKGLRVQRLEGGGRTKPVGEEWLYALDWKRHEGTLSEQGPEGEGAWLVLSDARGTGDALAELLEARGQRCVTVVASDGYEKLEAGRFRVNATAAEDYRRVLKEAFGDAGCRGVVHLWSLDASDTEDLEQALRQGSQSALYLAQSLVRQGWRDTPRLWLATRGAHAVKQGDSVALAQTPLWGFGRALTLEHPELQTILVDVVGENAKAQAHTLLKELGATDGETQVAWRGEARYAARLSRGTYEALGGEPKALEAEATYLLTGGLGGLGLSVAKWMVEKGARHLVLMGRSEPTEAARQTLQELEKAGARVVVERADVSKREQLEAAFARMEKELPPLKGVVHAAVVLEDRTVLEMDGERFARPMPPKVQGAWNLHTLTADKPLDFFIMYSSAASLLGSPGQSNYAAANAFMDALAHHRRSQGLTGLSINWGAFSDVGQAAAQANRGERLSFRGISGLKPAQGTTVLGRLLSSRAAQVSVMQLDARQ
ncbi:MAG TPA: SDR family NAD(P)-dependent oxidoreductase, partial [Archangium sp.]|nr:SDR family NAD(P)-dependent oxidoreductase [Archangium sp.]